MTPRTRRNVQLGAAAVVFVGLLVIFPRFLGVVEMAAREVRYLWWVILLVALALWLLFSWGKRR
jgi:hypothetical protein